jgi:hypothetical protein
MGESELEGRENEFEQTHIDAFIAVNVAISIDLHSIRENAYVD